MSIIKKSKQTSNRFLAMLLAIMLVMTSMPLSSMIAFAEENISVPSSSDAGFSVTIEDTEHGSVTIGDSGKTSKKFDSGTTVKLKVQNDDGYHIDKLIASRERSGVNQVLTVTESAAAFKMPAENVVVKASFVEGVDESQIGNSEGIYTVSIKDSENGSVSFENTKNSSCNFSSGDAISLNIAPDLNYKTDVCSVNYLISDISINLSPDENNQVTFIMPSEPISIETSFEKIEASIDDPMAVEDEHKVETIENYILKNYDSQYVGTNTQLCPVNIISVAYTFADGSLLKEKTLDAAWSIDKDNDGWSDMDAILGEILNTAVVYAVDPGAKYAVAKIDNLNSEEFKVTDFLAVYNDGMAKSYDDIVYDYDTGLVYIPFKDFIVTDEDGVVFNSIRTQLMYTSVEDETEVVETSVNVSVHKKGISGESIDSGSLKYSVYADHMSFYLAENDKAVKSITEQTIDSVKINDVPLSSDYYSYDESEGVLTVNLSPSGVDVVDITLSNTTNKKIDTIMNSVKSVGVIDAYAATTYANGSSIPAINDASHRWRRSDGKAFTHENGITVENTAIHFSYCCNAWKLSSDGYSDYYCDDDYYGKKKITALNAASPAVKQTLNFSQTIPTETSDWTWAAVPATSNGSNSGTSSLNDNDQVKKTYITAIGYWVCDTSLSRDDIFGSDSDSKANKTVYTNLHNGNFTMASSYVRNKISVASGNDDDENGYNISTAYSPSDHPSETLNGTSVGVTISPFFINLLCAHGNISAGFSVDPDSEVGLFASRSSNFTRIAKTKFRVLAVGAPNSNGDGSMLVGVTTPTMTNSSYTSDKDKGQPGSGIVRVLYNMDVYGQLAFKKISSRTKITNNTNAYGALSTARFALYKGSNYVCDVLYDTSRGYFYKDKLDPGTYTLKELTVPTNYNKASDISVTIEAGETTTLSDVKDVPITGSLTVTKSVNSTDAKYAKWVDGNSSSDNSKGYGLLSEARYKVVGPKDRPDNEELVFSNVVPGQVLSDLPLGKYEITETSVPRNYDPNEIGKSQTITLTTSATKTVKFENTPLATKLTIEKTSANTLISNQNSNYTYANAKFTLAKNWTGSYSSPYTASSPMITDVNGHYQTVEMPYGSYTLTETAAPHGYALSADYKDGKTISLNNTNVTITVADPPENDPIRIILEKWDTDNSEDPHGDASLAGSIFRIIAFTDVALSDQKCKEYGDLIESGTNPDTIVDDHGNKLIQNILYVETVWDGTEAIAQTTYDGILNGYVDPDTRVRYDFYDNEHKPLSSSGFFDRYGAFRFPISTINIKEVKAPRGYYNDTVDFDLLSVGTASSPSMSNNSFTMHITASGDPDTTVAVRNLVENPALLREPHHYLGQVKIRKADFDGTPTSELSYEQGDASLAATFKIFNRSLEPIRYVKYDRMVETIHNSEIENLKDNEDPNKGYVDTIVANKDNGWVASVPEMSLPYGTYEAIEVGTSNDYNVNSWRVIFQITADGQVVNLTTKDAGEDSGVTEGTNGQANNPVKRGGVSLIKFTQDFFEATPEGDATLAGAEFTIYNHSKNMVYMPNWCGTSSGKWCGTAYNDDNINDDTNKTAVIKTDANGHASTSASTLPIGTYIIKETKPSNGYKLNSKWFKKFTITNDDLEKGYVEIPASNIGFDFNSNDISDKKAIGEDVIRGGIRIYKSDKDRSITEPHWNDDNRPQGDASLAGAQFVIINHSTNPVLVKDADGHFMNAVRINRNDECDVLVTDEHGIAESNNHAYPYGTYYIWELPKSSNGSTSPEGYFTIPESQWHATVQIREDGAIVEANRYDNNPVQEPIYRAGFKFQKIDAEREINIPQGDASLKNAKFEVYNRSKEDVYVNNTWYAPGEVCFTFYTHADGYYETATTDVLPYGTYEVKEAAPSLGYLNNDSYSRIFSVRENGSTKTPDGRYDLTDTPCAEQVIRGDVQLIKYDKELNKSEAIGGKEHNGSPYGTNLNGIQFEIINRSVSPDAREENDAKVMVDGVLYAPGEVVKTIVTHWNEDLNAYTAETTGKTLPYGTYELREKAYGSNGYYLRNDAIMVFQIREDGVTVKKGIDGETRPDGVVDINPDTMKDLIWRNQVVRGDIHFNKIADGKRDSMPTAWIITNLTTNERHVIVTDYNGEYNSHSLPEYSASLEANIPIVHSFETNANDALLDRIDAGERIDFSEFKQGRGTWFGLGEFGSMAPVNDNLCAFPFGKYHIQEIPTDTNEGYNLQDFDFYIYKNNLTVDIGTITDDPIEVSTELIDDETNGHVGYAQEESVLVDTVEYSGLFKDKDYILESSLVDTTTNAVIATESKEFKGKTSGKITQSFVVNTEEIAGHNVVAYEVIIDKDTGYTLAVHTDIDDLDQTVHFPKISTVAITDITNDHDVPATGPVVITDTVRYENLDNNHASKFKLTGVLIDKNTGDEVFDSHGRTITANKTFTATEPNGEVELQFNADLSDYAGHTIVVFEELTRQNTPVAVHQDLEDAEQSIYVPDIGTKASFEATGTNEGAPMAEGQIFDTVEYKNLLVGKTYTLSAKLMDKATGEVAKDSKGKELVEEKDFIPTSANGSTVVNFTLDTSDMQGMMLVAFETLIRNDIEMAKHEDIDDEDQTIYFPSVGTTATYGDTKQHEGLAKDNVIITDKVEYKNLTPGGNYAMQGVLYDQTSGAPLTDENGDEVTSTSVFTPAGRDGFVDMTFEFKGKTLAGHTYVAYESLIHDDICVAYHRDLNDDAQTVHLPKVRTVLVDRDTGFDEVCEGSNYMFIDNVEYQNLMVGHTYTVHTKLVDKDTEEELASKDSEYTAETANGSFTVEVPINTTGMAGKSIVAYETMEIDGNVVILDNDINNAEQTITIPWIATTAKTAGVDDNEGIVGPQYHMIDNVQYKNLVVGNNYMLTAVPFDKQTGEALVDYEGNIVSYSQGFIAEATEGNVDVDVWFDASSLAGKDIVIFETLTRDDVMLAYHHDADDESQTIHFPEISTSATYNDTTIDEGLPLEKTVITDTVSYKNLTPGAEYTVVGSLVDADTGEAVAKIDGKVESDDTTVSADVSVEDIISETTFVPEERNGEATVVFEFDAREYEGKTIVVYEKLFRSDVQRTEHIDINDTKQDIHFPSIGTTLVGAGDLHVANPTKSVTLTDTISYTNLTIGETYTVDGVLVDKETGKEIDGLTASGEFTPEQTNGTTVVKFVVNGSELVGKTVVAYETIKRGEYVVAEHKDLEDDAQTVHFTDVSTTFTDNATKSHMIAYGDANKFIDVVSYKNFVPGLTYHIKSTLIDKETGEAVKFGKTDDVNPVVETEFTPKTSDGTFDVLWDAQNINFENRTVVAFEEIYCNDVLVATHTDVNDANQTLHGMSVKTTATGKDGRSKTIDVADETTVLDTVEYQNLIPGKEYTIKGKLVDKETGKIAKAKAGQAAVEAQFTPKKSSGKVEVKIKVDTSKASGKQFVAFEEIYEGKTLIGQHADINDKSQTVTVRTMTKLRTGFENYAWVLVVIAALLVLAAFMVMIKVRKRRLAEELD